MEHISEHLQVTAKPPAGNSLSKASEPIFSLEPEENKIIELKYLSKPFVSMSLADRTKWAKALLLKISIITGWHIPENETLNVLIDQFEKKLVESYPKVNPDEVEYAFRNTGTTVKDWGKSMNLSLIDEVMIPYLSKRFELSKVEEQKKMKMIENKPEMSDEELWEQTEALVKKGGYQVDLIPSGLYEWMDREGNILFNREAKREYIERATLYRHSKLASAFENDPNNRQAKTNLFEFNQMRDAGVFEGSEVEIIKGLAKKMIVFDMMKTK